jgi:hypothetical protein
VEDQPDPSVLASDLPPHTDPHALDEGSAETHRKALDHMRQQLVYKSWTLIQALKDGSKTKEERTAAWIEFEESAEWAYLAE